MMGMFIEMAVIIGVTVWLATMVWKNVDISLPSLSLPEDTQPSSTASTTVPEDTEPVPTEFTIPEDATGKQAITLYAEHMGITVDDYNMGFKNYPDKLYDAYEKCPEARDFILNAPFEYDKEHTVDMTEFEGVEGVPLFMQWDERWGYTTYAYGLGGITGCGPTCLAMVNYFYTKNAEMTPAYMMKFSEENGYVGSEGGTEWILFSKGGPKLGFEVKEVPLDKNTLVRKLEAGIPVICHVGESIFTYSGHYIVLVGYEDGRILVNDPNSVELSNRGCTWEEIEDAIKNMWAFTLPEEA